MDANPKNIAKDPQLIWYDDLDIGYYPVELVGQYDKAYWDKYVKYRSDPIADSLMKSRSEIVERLYGNGPVVDIGIGSGHFIDSRRASTFGYDVNPIAIRWLLDRDLWWDPYVRDPEVITCWDSLEHMARPEALVRCVKSLIFLSIPIFVDLNHVIRSKHYRPTEHFWYFTRDGLVAWMRRHGFNLVEENQMETDLGREDIGTFVFRRVENVGVNINCNTGH